MSQRLLPRFRQRLRFQLERMVQRGAGSQLLVIALAIGLVAAFGGLMAWSASDGFRSFPQAVWWGFLRLTDPGYLGDDEGAWLRAISTVLTVLGYVLFMGSLIAILTQWLNRKMRQLESGLTPVALDNHVVILGWTNRTPEIVSKLVGGMGRLRRFLLMQGARRLRIVILVEKFQPEMPEELRQDLGRLWNPDIVVFRTGTPLKAEHLLRVDPINAAAIIVPAADFLPGGRDQADLRAIKILLSLQHPELSAGHRESPPIIAEIFDERKEAVARKACRFPLEIVSSDAILARLFAQSCLHPGIWPVFSQLLSHQEGNSLYVKAFPELAGVEFGVLNERFSQAIPLGIVRKERGKTTTLLNPQGSLQMEAGDLLILIAESYDDCVPGEATENRPFVSDASAPAESLNLSEQSILILGLGQKIERVIEELSGHAEGLKVTILSRTPVEKRQRYLREMGRGKNGVQITHEVGDYSDQQELENLQPWRFERIILLSSDWMHSAEEADARTVLGCILLRSLLAGRPNPPPLLVELMDAGNASLLGGDGADVVVSPLILSHLLAHVAMRRELMNVFDELFGQGGAEFGFRQASDYGLTDENTSFGHVQRLAGARGDIAVGLEAAAPDNANQRIILNPGRDMKRRWNVRDRVIVLFTSRGK